MKNLTIFLCAFTATMFQNIAFSQLSQEEENLKKKQIEGYIYVIKNSPNEKEVEKAKTYLLELGVKYEEIITTSNKVKETESEEQIRMYNSLTPEEYNKWKASKQSESEVKPNKN